MTLRIRKHTHTHTHTVSLYLCSFISGLHKGGMSYYTFKNNILREILQNIPKTMCGQCQCRSYVTMVNRLPAGRPGHRACFLVWAAEFCLFQLVPTNSGNHPAFYPVVNGALFPTDKAAGEGEAKVNNPWSYTSASRLACMAWC
jgi:hypothetical protein